MAVFAQKVPAELREFNVYQTLRLLENLETFSPRRATSLVMPAFERRYTLLSSILDVRASICDFDLAVDAVRLFGAVQYQGDEFWDLFTTLAVSNLATIADVHLLLDLVRGFASARRGSDTLWELFVKKINSTPHPNEAAKTAAALRMLLDIEIEQQDGAYLGLSLASLMPLLQPGLVVPADQKYSSQACEDLYRLALAYPGISDDDAKTLQAAVVASNTSISRQHRQSIERMIEASIARRGGDAGHLLTAQL